MRLLLSCIGALNKSGTATSSVAENLSVIQSNN
jgi:hypothetical protein